MAGGTDPTLENATSDGFLQQRLLEQAALSDARERALLASAIHDDPMQLIVASMLQIDYLRMNPTVDDDVAWEKVIGMLETSVERLRRLITAITPADLSNGLSETLRVLAFGIFMGSTTAVTVRPATELRLTTFQGQVAHQILRRGLLNAREHARASDLQLTLQQTDRFVATLSDDGVGGVDPSGLAGMRTLADKAGGALRIESPPGIGTTLTLSLATPAGPVAPSSYAPASPVAMF